ncbi:MAG: carbamoyltransferase HypF, partial [Thermodesulfobacteriota bacterium]
VWGGEFLLASRGYFIRKGQIKYIPMPGGEKAIKEPWRMAISYLYSLYGDELPEKAAFFVKRFEKKKIEIVMAMCKTRINTPLTSSCGRLFDAVASILGLNDYATFEAEAAICLEKAASCGIEFKDTPFSKGGLGGINESYHFVMDVDKNGYLELDVLPLISRLVEDIKLGVEVSRIAMKFHNTVAEMILMTVKAINEKDEDIRRVVLSGGAFQNVLLLEKAANLLEKEGFKVFHSENVPPNDGGLSLGQAIIALEKIKVPDFS